LSEAQRRDPQARDEPTKRAGRKLARTRKEHPWAFAGALLGGLGTFITALISALALVVDDGGDAPPTPQQPPPPVTQPDAAYTYAGGIDGHGTVADDERMISVRVPDQWANRDGDGWFPSDVEGVEGRVGPGLNASPAIDAWADPEAPTPGIFFGASKDARLLALHTPRSLLETVGLGRCSAGAIEDNTFGALEGALVEHTCPDSPVRWFSYAWSPRSRSYLVFLQVKLVSERDEDALRRILTTLDVSRFARR
jgi:hypothetical protein